MGYEQSFLHGNGLHSSVVVILVNLLVYRSDDILMLVRANVLLGDGLAHILVNRRRVLPIAGDKVRNGLLGFLHGQ